MLNVIIKDTTLQIAVFCPTKDASFGVATDLQRFSYHQVFYFSTLRMG